MTEQPEPKVVEVHIHDEPHKKVANITVLNAEFWGRPNFAGEEDRFRDSSRKYTLLFPPDVADRLADLGWPIKFQLRTSVDSQNSEYVRFNRAADVPPLTEGQELFCSLKVKVDMSPQKDLEGRGSKVFMKMGDQVEKLNSATVGAIDRSRIVSSDHELRAWEYDPEDDPGKFSARLVEAVVVINPNLLAQRHGVLG